MDNRTANVDGDLFDGLLSHQESLEAHHEVHDPQQNLNSAALKKTKTQQQHVSKKFGAGSWTNR